MKKDVCLALARSESWSLLKEELGKLRLRCGPHEHDLLLRRTKSMANAELRKRDDNDLMMNGVLGLI